MMILEKVKITQDKAIKAVAKSYNTLDYSTKLVALLNSVYPAGNFSHLSKYDLHKLVNDTLFENHNGEEILKYKLFECYQKKQSIVAAFEIKVKNSRVDFLTINGSTTSFEIKSELDTLTKLKKQMADYLLAFEYNYLVIDHSHVEKVKEMLPDGFGLWSYKNGKYRKSIKSELNTNIDPEVQLSLLTKKELVSNFPEEEGSVNRILSKYHQETINDSFKSILKERYKGRWQFLKSNHNSIFPIDLQFFFNTNITPNDVYY
jgi:hypothetical protein